MQQVIILHNQIPQDAPEDVLDILRQAQWIEEILTERGYQVQTLPFSLAALERLPKDVVIFNLVDSAPGEEQLSYLAAGILQHLALPYTGCSLASLYLSTDKVLSKLLLKNHGLPTPLRYEEGMQEGTFLIKPTNQDASVGLDETCLVPASLVMPTLEAKQALLGCPCFAEQYVDGREFTVCMYGTEGNAVVLPPYEWVFKDYETRAKIITYDAKWTEDTFGYTHIEPKYTHDGPDGALLQELKRLAQSCWDVFGLSGYARVDYRVDAQNRPYILELNANPSFYGFYHLAKEWNFSFEDIIVFLVEHAHRL
ncbi:MAG: D-alanine--D-alanine ligase [Sphaerochaeta sp.]|jgi:D-alanine-D-alanine ligase|uniref:D-alanine--D-alanine ligase family protein n=1 Tax=Sphaerochaeta sp. TaxID=1972642 RepID=UPI002FC7A6C5